MQARHRGRGLTPYLKSKDKGGVIEMRMLVSFVPALLTFVLFRRMSRQQERIGELEGLLRQIRAGINPR
jgi:hypothetical protein